MKALAEEFANLEFTNEKTVITDGTANQSSTSVIQKALAKYDFITGKYGSSTYADFLGRFPTSSQRYGLMSNISKVTGSSLAVVTATVVGLISLITLFTIRKKKHN